MQFDWRAISGPALTIATALIAIVVDRFFIVVPSPTPLVLDLRLWSVFTIG